MPNKYGLVESMIHNELNAARHVPCPMCLCKCTDKNDKIAQSYELERAFETIHKCPQCKHMFYVRYRKQYIPDSIRPLTRFLS